MKGGGPLFGPEDRGCGSGSRGGRRRLVQAGAQAVFSLKSFHAPGRIHQFLLAGEERMTLGADLQADVALGGTRLEGFPAGAGNRNLDVFRMDFRFHGRNRSEANSSEPRQIIRSGRALDKQNLDRCTRRHSTGRAHSQWMGTGGQCGWPCLPCTHGTIKGLHSRASFGRTPTPKMGGVGRAWIPSQSRRQVLKSA